MIRNDALHWFILGFGLSTTSDDRGRPTNITQLWLDAKERCFDCDRNEVLDALYTLPQQHVELIKFVSDSEGIFQRMVFEQVRNTKDWSDFFMVGYFNVKVLPEGRVQYQKLSEQLRREMPPPEPPIRPIGFVT